MSGRPHTHLPESFSQLESFVFPEDAVEFRSHHCRLLVSPKLLQPSVCEHVDRTPLALCNLVLHSFSLGLRYIE